MTSHPSCQHQKVQVHDSWVLRKHEVRTVQHKYRGRTEQSEREKNVKNTVCVIMSDLPDEPVDVVVHKQIFQGIRRDDIHLIPCGELIKRFKLLELYDNSTLSRRRMKMGIATCLALPAEISILRKEKIISSSTNRCVLMDKNSAERYIEAILKSRGVSVASLQQNVTKEPLHTAPDHTTENMNTTGTDIEQADIVSEGNSLREDQSLAVEVISDSETVTHSSPIQKHPPGPHMVISEDDGSHTAINDMEVVPWISDVETSIKQASTKGSTRGRKGTPPLPENLMKEIEGLDTFYAAPFNHERKGKPLSSITLNKTKEQILCEL